MGFFNFFFVRVLGNSFFYDKYFYVNKEFFGLYFIFYFFCNFIFWFCLKKLLGYENKYCINIFRYYGGFYFLDFDYFIFLFLLENG